MAYMVLWDIPDSLVPDIAYDSTVLTFYRTVLYQTLRMALRDIAYGTTGLTSVWCYQEPLRSLPGFINQLVQAQ
eukprot:2214143-Rhodomonas_salina.1